MASGINAIANLQGKVDANGALLVTLSGGTATATTFVGPAADNTSAPPFTFTSDTNTGIASAAADTVNVVTGGTSRLSVSTTAVTSVLPVTVTSTNAAALTVQAATQATAGDLTVTTTNGSGQVTVGRLSGTASDNTMFIARDRLGATVFSVNPTTSLVATGTGISLAVGTTTFGSDKFVIGDPTNGQRLGFTYLTELTTIAAAATTDTTIQMPANSVVLGVSVRVTTVIPTAATFTVGDSGSATRFSTATVSTAATSTDPGTKAGAYYNASALSVRITPDVQPAANTGRVRVTIFYYTLTPPTS